MQEPEKEAGELGVDVEPIGELKIEPLAVAILQDHELKRIASVDHSKDDAEKTVPFFPDHAISEATAVFLMLSFITFLVIFFPAHLDVKANPMVTPAGSKPEWYYFAFYAFLRLVPPLVGVLVPVIGTGLLFFLPWLDRNPERAPGERVFAMFGSLVLLAIVVILTLIGYLE
ncbi:MAG: hypothetical protein M1548_03170 [Actinobacteria bacterium]|nr:hypothetical protein [Actinomycetota bacterium]